MYSSSVRYSQSTLVRFNNLLGTICASVLSMASTIGLCYIHGIVLRLVMVGVFAATFSVVLSIFTNLKANEVFFATTGYVLFFPRHMHTQLTSPKVRCCPGCVRRVDEYLRLLRSSPICLAITVLHESI